MDDDYTRTLKVHHPAWYQIHLQGALDPSWTDYVGGMQIEVDARMRTGPVTVLQGEVANQAALVGVLSLVYNLGFPLISVKWLDGQPEDLA